MGLDQLDGLFEVCDSGRFSTVMSTRDEVVDGDFVGLKERVDVLLVEDSTLR